jgi:two-component system, sensor histidine kinase and response regulator
MGDSSTSDIQILVVDDEMGLREGCRRVLKRYGYSVDVAATGREGLAKIRDGAFCLALIDVMMPDIGGLELLHLIHQHDPDIVCIIITGYATVELAVEAMKHGAYDFIAKPFSDDNLLLAVNKAVDKHRLEQEARRLQRIEQEARQLALEKAMLEELDRVKSGFMRKVAHELRAPIAAIDSLMSAILDGYGSPEVQRVMQQHATIRARELLSLVDDLLNLSRLKDVKVTPHKQKVCLRQVLDDVLRLHAAEAERKRIRLDLDCRECPPLLADPVHIQQLWTNLISNAIKYTPDGGQVSVSLFAEVDPATGPAVIVGKVKDTGIGIAAADMPRLFEEFYRTDQAKAFTTQGTGLGLSIVMQVLEECGGEIGVESEPGRGSEFVFRLPVAG